MAKAANSAPATALKGSNGAPIAIEMLAIDDLVPYEKNARSHPPAQIAKLAASVREYGLAAAMSNRICLGLELNEAYVDVIVQRFIDFSGEQATLEGDGRTFDEIKQERHGKDQDADAA